MFHDCLEEKQYTPWLTVSLLAPVLQAASGCAWPVAAGVVGITGLLCWGLGKTDCGGGNTVWVRRISWFWVSVVTSQMLHWVMYCWTDYDSYHAVPLTILLLAAWAVWKGSANPVRIGCSLLWPLLAVFGLLLLSAGKEVKPEYLTPTMIYGNSHLVTVLLIPALGIYINREQKKLRQFAGYSTAALVASAVAMGVLSGNICRNVDSPFYEVSRSVKILEFAQRLESLAAAAMTLGYFLTVSFLLEIQRRMQRREPVKKGVESVAIPAVLTAVLLLSNITLDAGILAMGSIVCWVMLPGMQRIKNVLKNGK